MTDARSTVYNLDSYIKLAELQIQLGKYKEAKESLEKAATFGASSLVDQLTERLSSLEKSDQYEVLNEAVEHLRGKEFELAARSLESKIMMDVSFSARDRAYDLLKVAYKVLGVPRAIEGYDRISGSRPSPHDTLHILSRVHMAEFLTEEEEYEKAIDVYDSIIGDVEQNSDQWVEAQNLKELIVTH